MVWNSSENEMKSTEIALCSKLSANQTSYILGIGNTEKGNWQLTNIKTAVEETAANKK